MLMALIFDLSENLAYVENTEAIEEVVRLSAINPEKDPLANTVP